MESIKEMIRIIVKMVEAHKNALEVEETKKELLIAGDAEQLKGLLISESELIEEIQQLEQQRMQAVAAYMAERGVKGESFTLEEVMKLETSSAVKNTLQTLAKELRRLISEIATLNETNQLLIENSLSYVQYSIGMLVPKEPSAGYGPNSGKRYSSLLDAKI